jgi:exodeoxyribonuclease VII small subunit
MSASLPADPNTLPAATARAEDTAVPAGVDSYEGALAELERLVSQMEGGQMPLDQLLHGYRRGAELLAYCRARLPAVESQVKVLEDGQLRDWTGA